MKNLLLIVLLAVPLLCSCEQSNASNAIEKTNTKNKHLLLKLSKIVDGEVVSHASVVGSQVDPNVRSIDDFFQLYINSEEDTDLVNIAEKIATDRRQYSYDYFTKGITDNTAHVSCMLGGVSIGWILETRYLTYDNNSILQNSELKPILSEAENCLFLRIIRPSDPEAYAAASKTLGQLQLLLLKNNK